MRTVNQEGQLNNYASEPPISIAEYPDAELQNRFALQGAAAILFVGFLLLTAFGIS